MWKFDHHPLARLPGRRSLLPLLTALALAAAGLHFTAGAPLADLAPSAAAPVVSALESEVTGLPALALRFWLFLPAFLPHA